MKNQIKRLQKIDSVISEANKLFFVGDLYPQNLEEEKKRFFESTDYNPQFIYNKNNVNFKHAYKTLKSIKFKDNVMDKIFKEKSIELHNILKMHENIGKDNFTKYSVKVYGKPSKELIEKALKIIKRPVKEDLSKKTVSSESAVEQFKKIFNDVNLNWHVKEKEIASNAVVSPVSRVLTIKKGAMFSKKDIRRFIVHEIYTHALRTEFGLRQPYKIFSYGLTKYEATEEGLALYKEKRAGVLDKKILKGYAGRVLAVDKALHLSFRETYNCLIKYFSSEKAWTITVRVKRGLKDTSKKGAFTKDYSYLKGFYEVTDFIKNQSGLHLLHYGKINTKQALLIPSIEGLKNPFILLKSHFKKKIHELSILY